MNILIVGGTGFIGRHLTKYFLSLDYQVTILSRNPYHAKHSSGAIHFITELNAESPPYEVIINLAGEPLNKKRWNFKVKNEIYQSRINTTQNLIHYIKISKIKPKLLISGSAIGYYGNSIETVFTENSKPSDNGFTHLLCADWEKTALQATEYGVRVCLIRTGIVLGADGGALKEMLTPFRLGLGAKIGNGKQWLSWIHIDDVIRSIEYLITHPELNGAFNLTAPNPVTNYVFTQELARALKRPAILSLPTFIVKLLFGEMAEHLLLNGQNVIPEKLMKHGFSFKYLKPQDAFKSIIS